MEYDPKLPWWCDELEQIERFCDVRNLDDGLVAEVLDGVELRLARPFTEQMNESNMRLKLEALLAEMKADNDDERLAEIGWPEHYHDKLAAILGGEQ